MNKVLILQLDSTEKPGFITKYLNSKRVDKTVLPLFKKATLAPTDYFTHLIVLPSPMNTSDYAQHPFLWYAKSIIRDFLFQKKPILGVCMGSQLLAEILGEKIRKANRAEVGFYPITFVKDSRITNGIERKNLQVFEWHSMQIATHMHISQIAKSANCKTQIFQFSDNVFGVQFHLEITEKLLLSYYKKFDPNRIYKDVKNQKNQLQMFEKTQKQILDNFLQIG